MCYFAKISLFQGLREGYFILHATVLHATVLHVTDLDSNPSTIWPLTLSEIILGKKSEGRPEHSWVWQQSNKTIFISGISYIIYKIYIVYILPMLFILVLQISHFNNKSSQIFFKATRATDLISLKYIL